MIERTIGWCGSNRLFVLVAAVALAMFGAWSARQPPLDALPDLSDVQVIVTTEWPGRSPDLIEDQVTYPIVSALLPTPNVRAVRGFTDFGMSFVYVIFDDGTDIYWARSRVLEYLNQVRDRLPPGVSPTLGPDATGVGWVFEYALVDDSGKHDLTALRSLQDWNLRYALGSVKGVAEVATVGGLVKEYTVELDPDRLRAYGVTTHDVVTAIQRSNADVGGAVMEIAGHENVVRGRGYVRGTADLEMVPLRVQNGTPVLVRDVAHVTLAPEIRRGVADLDGKGEAVGGIVIMRYGENALDVIDGVKARIAELEAGFAANPDTAGVHFVATYDRSQLIRESIATLRRTLVEE